MKDDLSSRVLRLVSIAYLVLACWLLLGRPDVRVKLLWLTRKALRRLASGAARAADATEETMLHVANANITA